MKEEIEETDVESEHSILDENYWRISGGSIWNHTQGATTRVKCRATTCQLVQVVKFMEKHPELAVSHAKPFPGSDELWMKLAEHINQFGPPKTYKQCKTTWRDLRKRAFAMQRNRNKKGTGRNLYGMAPKIVSLITQAGLAPTYDKEEEGGTASSNPETPPPVREPLPEPVPGTSAAEDVQVEKTKGEQLVIRVMDNMNSKRNVFNRFTINDGHFENVIVKEERLQGGYQSEEQEMEPTEAEVDEPHDQMFPQPEAILGGMDEVMEEKDSVIRDLNDTLRKFLAEYKTRNALMRERIDLERARLQFDMEVYRSRQMETRVIAVNAANAANVMGSNAANFMNAASAANSMNAASAANAMNANAANVMTNARTVRSNNNTKPIANAGNENNANVKTVNTSNTTSTANVTTTKCVASVKSVGNASNVVAAGATSSNAAKTTKANPVITVGLTNTANTGNSNNNCPSHPVMTLNPITSKKTGNAGISVKVSLENNVASNSPNAANIKNVANAKTETAVEMIDDSNIKKEDAMDET